MDKETKGEIINSLLGISFKLIDRQGCGMLESHTFKNKEEVREELINFHSIDNDINSLMKLTLNELLDFGEWDIKEVIKNKKWIKK